MIRRKSSRASGIATTPGCSGEGDRAEPAAARAAPWLCEPTTTLTDYLLAALAIVFAARLMGRGWALGEPGVLAWGAAFVAVAATAVVGGTVHGFAPRLGERLRARLWSATLVLAAMTGFLLLAGAALSLAPGRTGAVLVGLAAVKLIAAVTWMIGRHDFRSVLLDSGASLLLVLALAGYAAWRGGAPGAGWLAGGVVLSLVGGGVQASGVTLHRHFNHNDLYHVIQMVAAYLLFRGGMLM